MAIKSRATERGGEGGGGRGGGGGRIGERGKTEVRRGEKERVRERGDEDEAMEQKKKRKRPKKRRREEGMELTCMAAAHQSATTDTHILYMCMSFLVIMGT